MSKIDQMNMSDMQSVSENEMYQIEGGGGLLRIFSYPLLCIWCGRISLNSKGQGLSSPEAR